MLGLGRQSGKKLGREVELPKIALPTPHELHYHHLTHPKDYSALSNADIDQEYQQLRRLLVTVNEQAARNVAKIAAKPLRQSRVLESSKVMEVRDREIDNNRAILARLRYELEQLQRRASCIEGAGKDQLEQNIASTREQIVQHRLKVKELKMKSRSMGENLESSDEVFAEIKQLERECEIAQRKRGKLEEREAEVGRQMEKVAQQLGKVDGGYQLADSFIEEQLECEKQDEEQLKMQRSYRHGKGMLDAIRKNVESVRTVKQQKYHQLLKQLQGMTVRMQEEEQQINSSEVTHLNQVTLIEKLEQQLKEALSRVQSETHQEVFYTAVEETEGREMGSESGNSDKKKTSPSRFIGGKQTVSDGVEDVQRRKQNSSRNKPLHNNRTQAKINQIQQRDETNRTAKINSSTNKKTLDPDHVYEKAEAAINTALKGPLARKNRSTMRVSSESEGSTIQMGKQSLIFNPIQNGQQAGIINRITQNKLNSQTIQSATFKKQDDKQVERERKVESKKVERVHKMGNQVKKSEEIAEEIHVEPAKKEEKVEQQSIAEELDEKHLQLSQLHKPQQPKHPPEEDELTRKKSLMSNYVSQEDSDEDIASFQQIISQQRQKLTEHKLKIEIPLTDITANIRRHEQLSKINKLNKSLDTQIIREDEESFS